MVKSTVVLFSGRSIDSTDSIESTVKLDSHCTDSYRPMNSRYRRGIHRQAHYIHIVVVLSAGRIMNWELSTLHHNSDLSRSVCKQLPV